ncbi:unnamed protein product [Mucor circinelloides]
MCYLQRQDDDMMDNREKKNLILFLGERYAYDLNRERYQIAFNIWIGGWDQPFRGLFNLTFCLIWLSTFELVKVSVRRHLHFNLSLQDLLHFMCIEYTEKKTSIPRDLHIFSLKAAATNQV